MNVVRHALWFRAAGAEPRCYFRPGTPLFERLTAEGLHPVPVRKTLKYFDLPAAASLAARLKTDRVTGLIFFHTRDFHAATLCKAVSRSKPTLVYQQHMQLGVDKKGPLHAWQFDKLDYWVAPLEGLARQAQERANVAPDKLRVIPLAIETARFSNLPSKSEARNRLGLPADKTIFGIVGRLDPGKGQHVFVEAMRLLRKSGNDFVGVLFGDPTVGEHEKYANALRSAACEYIRFFPARPDIETVFAALDVFVLCSRAETYGMVTLEALAAGTAVVATDSGGTPELLEYGKLGSLYPAGDAQALASVLLNPPPRPDGASIREKYAPDKMVAAYLRLFEQ